MTTSRLALSAAMALLGTFALSAGAPPTVMVLPDKTWCNAHDYVDRSERNGRTRITENYEEAFLNSELKNVVVNINDLLKQSGLPPKDYAASSEIDDAEEAEEELFESEDSGAEVAMTPYEAALSKLKPDIILKIGWDVYKTGFNYSLSYRLEALDSYSGKSIAAVTAETPTMKTTVPLAAAIKNAATEHMGNFVSKLQEHFDDIQENGREITITLRITDNGSGMNFNTEYNGVELNQIVHQWLNDNTVNHVFSERNASRNRLQYEQVRIPLKDARGTVMQARQFVAQLKNHLKANYSIDSENATKGLGSGRLYLGK